MISVVCVCVHACVLLCTPKGLEQIPVRNMQLSKEGLKGKDGVTSNFVDLFISLTKTTFISILIL